MHTCDKNSKDLRLGMKEGTAPAPIEDLSGNVRVQHVRGRAGVPPRPAYTSYHRPRAALAVAWFAVCEGGEAWHGELACGG